MARAKKAEEVEVNTDHVNINTPQVNINQTEEDIRLQKVARGEDVPQTEVEPEMVDVPEDYEPKEVSEEDEKKGPSTLEEEAYALREETVRRHGLPRDGSKVYAARATFDTSGNAGEADGDFRRAYASFDYDALNEEDMPDHVAKYVVSQAGAPAIYEREEEARKHSNPKEGRDKKDEE